MKQMQAFFDELASQGRHGDTMLAHINPQEANLLKALGGSGTINPKTGLPEFWGISIPGTSIGIGSDYGGVSVGGTSTGDIAQKTIDTAKGAVDTAVDVTKGTVDTTVDVVKGAFNTITDPELRDSMEAAAVIAANYFYPGSALITSKLVSDGAKEKLGTDWGKAAILASGASGASQGNMSNWTGGSGSAGGANVEVGGPNPTYSGTETPLGDLPEMSASEALDIIAKEQAANMTDAEILAQIQAEQAAAQAAAATPAQVAAANAAGMSILDYAKAGLLVNALTGDPLGLGGDKGDGGSGAGGTSGFAQVDVPSQWKSPTYNYTPVQNVSFEDLFPGVSLQGTQWQGLQNAQPNMTFNDIFAAGQQQTPMGTPVDINQIVSSIVGQTAKS